MQSVRLIENVGCNVGAPKRFLQKYAKYQSMKYIGAPGGTRTPDTQVRSLVLYPTELRARGQTAQRGGFRRRCVRLKCTRRREFLARDGGWGRYSVPNFFAALQKIPIRTGCCLCRAVTFESPGRLPACSGRGALDHFFEHFREHRDSAARNAERTERLPPASRRTRRARTRDAW